jgi:hypothetical protein
MLPIDREAKPSANKPIDLTVTSFDGCIPDSWLIDTSPCYAVSMTPEC